MEWLRVLGATAQRFRKTWGAYFAVVIRAFTWVAKALLAPGARCQRGYRPPSFAEPIPENT